MDFADEGLLDGLEGQERDSRRRLLQHLADDGVSLTELRAAVEEDRLALMPVERVLGGRYTAAEVEERTGLSAATLLRVRRVLGLPEAAPDDPLFGDEDLEMARSTQRFIEAGLSQESVAEMARVLGESMARLAATTTGVFVDAFLAPGDSEYDVAMTFARLAEEFTPAVHPVLAAAYDAHLREAVRRGMLGRAEREAGSLADAQEMTVCFADLVGFTRMGVQLEAEELGNVAGILAELASEITEPPVRLVKTIGDAAMFVSPEPGPLVTVALALVDGFEKADLPSLRAGVACGPALQRAGDYYGHSVNLASRVTGVARPQSVLCTQAVRDAAEGEFEWSFAGKHRLKGVGESLRLYRARPLKLSEESDDSGDGDHRRSTAEKKGRWRKSKSA